MMSRLRDHMLVEDVSNKTQLHDAPHPRPKSPEQYRYRPIQLHKPTFRLLRLNKVRHEYKETGRHGYGYVGEDPVDHIECDLVEQSFEYCSFFAYQAVSYVWGSTEKTHTISVDGANLYVTKNLSELLLNLWRQDQLGWLWIDGVCIDQDNVLEKNHQVQQMGSIFATADKVIFYLGDSTHDTNLLMDWLCKLNQLAHSEWGLDWYQKSANRTTTDLLVQVPPELLRIFLSLSRRLFAAIDDLLTRPWFKRVWVIQEVGNAQDGLIQCGGAAVPCRIFLVALTLLAVRTTGPEEFHAQKLLNIMPTELRDTSFLGMDHGRNLLCLLKTFPFAEATCEQDRIYALLGLSNTNENEIRVDYHEKSEAEIVQDTIWHIYRGITTKRLTLPFADIAAFLEAIEDLDYQVFNELIHLQDNDGVEVMLEDEQISSDLLKRFNKQLSRYGVQRLVSSRDGVAQVDRQVIKFAASNFDSRAEFVNYLMHHRKTRDLLWRYDGWGHPRSDCNIVINSKRRIETRDSFCPVPLTHLRSHFSTFLRNVAEQSQVIFWFSGIRRRLTDDVFSDHPFVEYSSTERYCAGIMWHYSEECVDTDLMDAIYTFVSAEEPSQSKRRSQKKTHNKPTKTSKIEETLSERIGIDNQLLYDATQWYRDDDVNLVSFQDADDPELWGFLEREMSAIARSCSGSAIRGHSEITQSWLSLIVFPSSRTTSAWSSLMDYPNMQTEFPALYDL